MPAPRRGKGWLQGRTLIGFAEVPQGPSGEQAGMPKEMVELAVKQAEDALEGRPSSIQEPAPSSTRRTPKD